MIALQKTHKRLLADIADNALRGFVTLQCALRTRTSSFRIPLSLLRGFGSLNSANTRVSAFSPASLCKTDVSTTHVRLLKVGD